MRGTDLADFVDPYLDPTTGVLHNLIGLTQKRELGSAEAALTFSRSLDLSDAKIRPSRDLSEVCSIHRHLFQDVYQWAGEIRTVDIRKNVVEADYFVPVSLIQRAARFAFEALAEDNFLHGLDREAFIARLAFHYDQLNSIHPFREGNGRAQRAFWGRVAVDAGWNLDWIPVKGDLNDMASRIAAEQQDVTLLIEMLDRVVQPSR